MPSLSCPVNMAGHRWEKDRTGAQPREPESSQGGLPKVSLPRKLCKMANKTERPWKIGKAFPSLLLEQEAPPFTLH